MTEGVHGGAFRNAMDDYSDKTFSKSAPDWRLISKGLNVEAECQTNSCKAFGKKVWTHFKHGEARFGYHNVIQRINRHWLKEQLME